MQTFRLKLRELWLIYRYPLLVFLISRIIIGLVYYATGTYRVGLPSWSSWDGDHYLSIIQNGYTFGGIRAQGNLIAFYPLFPLLTKFIAIITTLPALYAGLAMNFVLGAIGSCVFYAFIRDRNDKRNAIALTGVTLFLFYPMSVFLSAFYTESLFFVLFISALLAIRRQWFIAAAILIGLSTVTRLTGIVLIPIFFYEIWKARRPLFEFLCFGIIVTVPFLTHMMYQFLVFGTPLAFRHAQYLGWDHTLFYPFAGVLDMIRLAIIKTGSAGLMWRVDLILVTAHVATLILAYKRIERAMWWMGVGIILVSLSFTGPLAGGRYVWMIIPSYIIWAELLEKRPLVKQYVLMFLTAWMAFNAVLFFLARAIF